MTVLVVDSGTSGVRAVAVHEDGTVLAEQHREVLPAAPSPGLTEVDGVALAQAALDVARAVIDEVGAVEAVGLAVQRATTIVWDARDGRPIGPGLGWQDLRTVGRCLELRATGRMVAPNQSATKAEWLLASADVPPSHLRVGTIDTWLAWTLSEGRLHVTDATNAQVTGLTDPLARGWDTALLGELGIPAGAMATIVDSDAVVGEATALPGAPPIAALVGDQQASLIGQGGIEAGRAKVTVGTGAMLDLCLGSDPGPRPRHGTFPVVARRCGGTDTWAREAVALSAGTAVEWLRDGLGLVDSAAETAEVAATVPDSGDVVFVPSLSGTGTPVWDHGARGLLLGITRGTTRAHVVRAVLEGVAHRVADLADAVVADSGRPLAALGLDGGMSANPVFVAAVAAATGAPVEVSGAREATALGAAFLAGCAVGTWPDLAHAVALRPPARTVEPTGTLDRERFADARERAGSWIPSLSALDL